MLPNDNAPMTTLSDALRRVGISQVASAGGASQDASAFEPYDFTVSGALWAASPFGYPSSTHAVNPSSKSAGLLLKGLSASSH
jgi:hypothetical protein